MSENLQIRWKINLQIKMYSEKQENTKTDSKVWHYC